ncbi:MAG: methylated-DNA--[protein]-cysteine S-methyltransferase [Acidimicrobiales bacterium]
MSRSTDSELVEQLAPVDGGVLEHLHGQLARLAEAEGLLDISYRTLDSPAGSLLLMATPLGLVRMAFEVEGHDKVVERLATLVGPRVLHSPRGLEDAARQLDEYFAGRRRAFDLALDMRLSHGFRAEVLAHLRRIPYGAVESYSAVAAAVGNPRAVRAVGTACATNPLPLVVPCHRVVRSDGSTGQYGGGWEVKRMLLALEAGSANR